MESFSIIDVVTEEKEVPVSEKVKIVFKIIGARAPFFEFPFSNESLTEALLQFQQEDASNATK